MNLDTSKYLNALKRVDNPPVTGAHVDTGEAGLYIYTWRCVLLYELTDAENGGGHHVYIDLLTRDGIRIGTSLLLKRRCFGITGNKFMAIAGGVKPSARLRLINGKVVVDEYQARHSYVLSSLNDKTVKEDGETYTTKSAVTKLLSGEVAYVHNYGNNIKDIVNAVEGFDGSS